MCELSGDKMQAAVANEEPFVAPTPREFFTVADKTGTACGILDSREYAEAKRVVYDNEYPNIGPHRVIHMREVPA